MHAKISGLEEWEDHHFPDQSVYETFHHLSNANFVDFHKSLMKSVGLAYSVWTLGSYGGKMTSTQRIGAIYSLSQIQGQHKEQGQQAG